MLWVSSSTAYDDAGAESRGRRRVKPLKFTAPKFNIREHIIQCLAGAPMDVWANGTRIAIQAAYKVSTKLGPFRSLWWILSLIYKVSCTTFS